MQTLDLPCHNHDFSIEFFFELVDVNYEQSNEYSGNIGNGDERNHFGR
jgi:hypothetical protein